MINIIRVLIVVLLSTNVYAETCLVSKIIDGDTLWCTFDDKSTKIRLIAIDTPEITNGKSECYGKEAKQYLEKKILNKEVRIEYDKKEPTYGDYGRLLAYIWADNININFKMIRNGYARALTKYPIYRHPIKEIVDLELLAIKEKKGLWKECY